MIDIVIGFGLLLLLTVLSSIFALWFKSASNEIRARREFPDTAEGGALIQHGISKNLDTGETKGQRRPSGISSVS